MSGPLVHSPKLKIQDIFYNVIGNAIKFSPPGSAILIDGTDFADFFEIRIRDQGPGLTPEDFTKLFNLGGKLSARPTAGENSTGLGLYSVKQALEAMGGSIEVKNNDDVGACFTIRFSTELHGQGNAKQIEKLPHLSNSDGRQINI